MCTNESFIVLRFLHLKFATLNPFPLVRKDNLSSTGHRRGVVYVVVSLHCPSMYVIVCMSVNCVHDKVFIYDVYQT